MATKTKAAVRSGSGKGHRRPPVKVKRGSDVPLLPIAVAAILLAFAIGVIIYIVVNNPKPTPQPAVAAGIPCDHWNTRPSTITPRFRSSTRALCIRSHRT